MLAKTEAAMKRMISLGVLFAVLMLAVPEHGGADLHFALSKSAPEKDTSVDSPAEVRLWFTEAPEDSTTSIRLVPGGGDEAVATGDVSQDPDDGRVFFIELDGALGAGQYTVAWRAMGQDGHVVRGDFGFEVAGR